VVAARLIFERVAPPRKGCPVAIALPDVKTSADVVAALAVIVAAVAGGVISMEEAQALAVVLESQRKAIETVTLEALASRVAALEQKDGSR
jgi:predicted aspartyl protease